MSPAEAPPVLGGLDSLDTARPHVTTRIGEAAPGARNRTDPGRMSDARARLSGHLAWNLGADLAARGASLWLSFFCARLLGVTGFGRFSFALAAAQYAWLIGDAALNGGYATRETARNRGASPRQVGLFWSARLVSALVVTALYLAAVALFPGEPATRRALAAAATFFLAYAAFPDWALRGFEDFRGLALGNVVYAAALVGVTLVLLPVRRDAALAVGLWGGCFALAALVTLPRLARRGVLRPRPGLTAAAWWPHARRSSLFSLGSVAAIGYTQLPLLLVGVLSTTRDTGLFSAGFRLLVAFIGALGIVWWPLMPVLTREPPDTPVFREVLGSSAALVLALSTPVALALTVFPAAVLGWLFGAEYAAGALALAIGAWVLPLYALTGLLEQTSLALGRERMRAGVAWTTLGVMTALALLLMPRLGALGAAVTATAGFALALGLYAVRLRAHIRLGDVFRPLVRAGVACLPLALLWLVAPRLIALPVWVWLATGVALYLPLAFGLGLLRLAPGLARAGRARGPREAGPPPLAHPVPRGIPRAALDQHPRVSVILAVRDEERHIARALGSVCGQSYPRDRIEILVVDGESTDGTREIVEAKAMRDPRVQLLHNPLRRVAGGLNVGLRAARGDVIVRVDGHCVIPPDYIETCVRRLRAGDADCVGGPVRAEGESVVGQAVAMAMSTPFGVGGASFRWASAECDVDHLPFGAWRRQVFEVIGPFDETLVRNQDDELSDRLRRAGGRIVLHPGIAVRYFSRSSLSGLWRQYLGYGYWKVRVIRKRGGWPSSPRHLVPAAFVCATLGALAVAAGARSWLPLACVLGPYAAFVMLAVVQSGATRRDRAAALLPAALATMHVAYGVGFLGALVTPADPTGAEAAERMRRAA